jgi:methanogenic corrinoid protein MtbC1
MPDSGRGLFAARALSQDDQIGLSSLRSPLWCPDGDTAPAPEMRSELARTIEAEIIPRLMLAHRTTESTRAKPPAAIPIVITDTDVAAFSEMIVRQPLSAARAHLDSLRERGLSAEHVITQVLSATARHLGVLWEQDRCTFVDVTVGLSRLQQLLRVYGPAFEAEPAPQGAGRRVLLAVVPGEQHTFGLAVVEEFFRRAGWHVQSEFLPSKPILLEHVRTEWFDVVGLSASGEVASAGVSAVVRSVRESALNKDVHIMLGGNLFVDDPGLALSLGADFGARDAAEAVNRVDMLFEAKKMSC